MAFFGKPKEGEQEFDEEGLEERPRARKTTRRAFKDLNPENRKRREPKKPWGKKERLLVLLVILLTSGASLFLALKSYSWKLPGYPRIKIPSFSIPSFLGEETILIEGRKKDQEKANRVVEVFTSQTRDLSGVWGLYVIRLGNGFSYGANEKEVFQAASLIKLPVMVDMYMEAEEGNLDLDEKYTLKSSDKAAGAGSLYSKPAGYEITYRNLIRLMGKESDNTAFNITRRTLGDEKIEEAITKLGMRNTSLKENETTPEDIGEFFEKLWLGSVVSDQHKEELLEFLTETSFEAWLAAGIPEDVRVSHKYAREQNVINDAGIVYADEPFIVVILSKGVIEKEADEIIPELSKIVYDEETR